MGTSTMDYRLFRAHKVNPKVSNVKDSWTTVGTHLHGLPVFLKESSSNMNDLVLTLRHDALCWLTENMGQGTAWHGW